MTEWLNKTHTGDVRAVLRRMIDDGVKVQTIVTSPPYWGLRSYLPSDHPDKALEIGSEPTLALFLETMVGVFNLAREVLADDGTLWCNMGDSYANDGKWGGETGGKQAYLGDENRKRVGRDKRTTGLPAKNLMGQPWRLAFALQDAGWYLRQDIIWSKPNPMPESIRDRCTKAHEYIFLLAKNERYYYDFAAMQEPVSGTANARRATIKAPDGWATHEGGHGAFHKDGREKGKAMPDPNVGRTKANLNRKLAEAGSGTKLNTSYDAAVGAGDLTTMRNKRSVWTVPSHPYSEAHFATFPPKLIGPCVLAGCPVGGTVLDIFMGSGTTAQVAQALGRNYIGIDIDDRNERLQANRTRQPSLIFGDAA